MKIALSEFLTQPDICIKVERFELVECVARDIPFQETQMKAIQNGTFFVFLDEFLETSHSLSLNVFVQFFIR